MKLEKQVVDFFFEHDRIMWLVRTARVYCESAENICKNVEKE